MDLADVKIGGHYLLVKPTATSFSPLLSSYEGKIVEVADIYHVYIAIQDIATGTLISWVKAEWLEKPSLVFSNIVIGPAPVSVSAPTNPFFTAGVNVDWGKALDGIRSMRAGGGAIIPAEPPAPTGANPFVRSRETAEFLGFCDACGGFREHRTYCKARAK